MSDTDPELDRLQDLLATIPPEWKGMNVVELDGYVAALIVCPDTIPSSEWLPGVWGSDLGFEDLDGTEETIAAVMEHCSRIARALAEGPEDYVPVLGMDTDSGEVLWAAMDRRLRTRHAAASGRVEADCAKQRQGGGGVAQHDRCAERLLSRPVGPDGRGGSGAQESGAGADPRVRVQSVRMEEVPARRRTQQGAGCVACDSRWPADRRRRNGRARV